MVTNRTAIATSLHTWLETFGADVTRIATAGATSSLVGGSVAVANGTKQGECGGGASVTASVCGH